MADRRLAVDDTVMLVRHDGTFSPGRIPKQETLGHHRSKQRCHDRVLEDLAGDPSYNQLLINIYPNEGTTDVVPANVGLIDRNLTVGQLVKNRTRFGFVRSLQQTASGRIYHPDPAIRSDPTRELYFHNQPADFFSANLWEQGQIVALDGWLGVIQAVVNNLTILVEFPNGGKHYAILPQYDMFSMIAEARLDGLVDRIRPEMNASRTFQINSNSGIFITRNCKLPYSLFHQRNGLTWSDPQPTSPPKHDSKEMVEVTVKDVRLHNIKVDWKKAFIPNTPKPITSVKNDDTRARLRLASHKTPIKIGDVRYRKMSQEDWAKVLPKYCWQNTISKDYFLHKKRNKRPRVDEAGLTILPADPKPKMVAVEILTTATTAVVEWDGGFVEQNIDSRNLIPVRYKMQFPGAITLDNEREHPHHNQREIVGLGPQIVNPFFYKVVLRSSLKKRIGKSPLYSYTVRRYSIQPGAIHPLGAEETTTETGVLNPNQQFRFWEENKTQVVVRMPNSHANFTYGCVVGMFQNGMTTIRITGEQGEEFLSVYPTDLIAVNPQPVKYVTHPRWGW